MAESGFSGPQVPENPSRASWALPGPIPGRSGRKYSPALMSIMEEVLEAYPDADHAYTVAEVQASAGKIEKYRERWTANGWHKPAWIERQKARKAKQTGKARKGSASPEGSNEALTGRGCRLIRASVSNQ